MITAIITAVCGLAASAVSAYMALNDPPSWLP